MTSTPLPPADVARTSERPPAATGGLRGVIRSHPLVAFFVLANVLSWAAWLPYVLSQNGLGVLPFAFPAVLGSSQILGVLPGAYLGPITAAFLITALVDGRRGLKAWGRRLWHWKVAPRWYAITLLGVPAGMILIGLLFSGGQIQAPSIAALTAFVPVLLFQMVTTGLAEEPGWRDFALPRLQNRFTPLRAAFVLGPLWALWHFPLFLTEWGGFPEASWTRPIVFTVFCIAFNIVMSWVFNRTGQSLPLSMLMHVGVNTFASVMWLEMFPGLGGEMSLIAMATGAVIAAVIIAIATRGRLGFTRPAADNLAPQGAATSATAPSTRPARDA
ncbi:CPBP family glutamic-type intramembrane protease [Microbacterium sp. RD1]|uniref:CPBP family glutamic-type intramembrane protease n=1 Tax=Microbacterium sp. RD1 TaxID=3457313 RepID=UPI003FA5D7D9